MKKINDNKISQHFYEPKITTGRVYYVDSNQPICVNIGCESKVMNKVYDKNLKKLRS